MDFVQEGEGLAIVLPDVQNALPRLLPQHRPEKFSRIESKRDLSDPVVLYIVLKFHEAFNTRSAVTAGHKLDNPVPACNPAASFGRDNMGVVQTEAIEVKGLANCLAAVRLEARHNVPGKHPGHIALIDGNSPEVLYAWKVHRCDVSFEVNLNQAAISYPQKQVIRRERL